MGLELPGAFRDSATLRPAIPASVAKVNSAPLRSRIGAPTQAASSQLWPSAACKRSRHPGVHLSADLDNPDAADPTASERVFMRCSIWISALGLNGAQERRAACWRDLRAGTAC